MNGEVNDIMDEPMDTSLSTEAGAKTTLELMECEMLNNCSNSNGTSGLHSDDGLHTSDDDNESVEHEVVTNQNPTEPTENNDEVPQENHCSNSNESYQDSVDGLPVPEGPEATAVPDQEPSDPNHSMVPNLTANSSENNVISDTDENDESEEEVESESQLHDDDDDQDQLNDTDIILIENSPLKQNGNKPIEIQVSSSDNDDDEPVPETDDKNKKETKDSDGKPPLRRSTRCLIKDMLKTKDEPAPNEDNCDLEVIAIDESISKNKPIVISDTKKLFDMATQQRPNNLKSDQTQLVIIDSNSRKDTKFNNKSMNAVTARNLYQSIAARGTTVTPVPARVPAPAPAHAAPAPAQPLILPSLTDDMYVVEAPSFIVPYVYEKPSKKPFREFVDILGKQLEEEKAKEQKLLLENMKNEKEKKDQDRKERKEKGEEVSEGESEDSAGGAQRKLLEKAKKKVRRQRPLEAADDSWDGESSCDSEDIPSDEDVPEVKQKHNNLAKLEGVVSNIPDKPAAGKSDNYFDCSLGKFFIGVGSSLVEEFVQADLLKQQTRKLHREKKTGQNTRETQTAIASLMNNLEFSKENNAPFKYTQQKCEFCSFKTESSLVMSHHLETPHMKNNLYQCNFCELAVRSSHEILLHAERAHAARGRLERAPGAHACPSCPFEDNGKGKLARHLVSCTKRFRPELNLAPPVDWEPPAKLPKMVKMKNHSFPTNFKAPGMGMHMNRPVLNMGIPNHMKMRARAPLPSLSRAGFQGVPIARAPGVVRHNLPTPVLISNYAGAQPQNKQAAGKSQPSISITPLPRAPPPQAAHQQHQHQAKGSFVICEICDGYIKDLEQLRNHMQWIHKVKIHPKMIYNRPPLNCQKCQFRFFTDQGLERHLLGSHGLVTSSMQEAANKGKDAGRCPVCGRVYQWKLLNHVARDHNLTLKPAHLSYKCTVCTATFGMYKLFENHVYSAHRVVAKRVIDKNKVPPAAKPSDSLLKPLKINDEITIIPQPARPVATTSKGK